MSNHIQTREDNDDIEKDFYHSGQKPGLNFCEFSTTPAVLNLTNATTIEKQQSWSFGAKRHATEGAVQLPEKMHSASGLPQTTLDGRIKHERERNTKSINITDVADKFLLGTMNAVLHLEGSSLSTDMSCCTDGYDPQQFSGQTDGMMEYNSVEPCDLSVERMSCQQKKVKSSYRPSRPPLLPPCRVCGDRASGYHYGVNTCEACKGFFRRSICKSEPYVCSGTGDCKTLGCRRTSCSHCRYKRCLAMGMSKNAIKTGRYTHELRSKNILEVKRLQKQGSDESSDNSLEGFSTSDVNTESQKDFREALLEETLAALVTGQTYLHEYLDDYYNDDLIRERQYEVYERYTKRKNLHLQLQENKIKIEQNNTSSRDNLLFNAPIFTKTEGVGTNQNNCIVDNSNCSETFRSIDANSIDRPIDLHSDKSKVSTKSVDVVDVNVTNDVRVNDVRDKNGKFNGSKMATGIYHTCKKENNNSDNNRIDINEKETKETLRKGGKVAIEIEKLRADVLDKIINDMEQGVQGMLAFAKCLPGFNECSATDQTSLLKAARFDIWYIGHIRCFNVELRVGACEWKFQAEELTQVWGESMVDLAFNLSRVAQGLNLTKSETAALRAVCLTFPDRCTDLQNREEVEQMHEHMLDVFKYVSCKRHTNYNKWFTKVINFLVMLREFGIKFESISSKLKLDWSVLKDNPLLLSVFLS